MSASPFFFCINTIASSPNWISQLCLTPERELRGQRSEANPPPLSTLNSTFTLHLKEEEGYMFWHGGPASKYLEDTDLALFRLWGGERAEGGIIEEKHEL